MYIGKTIWTISFRWMVWSHPSIFLNKHLVGISCYWSWYNLIYFKLTDYNGTQFATDDLKSAPKTLQSNYYLSFDNRTRWAATAATLSIFFDSKTMHFVLLCTISLLKMHPIVLTNITNQMKKKYVPISIICLIETNVFVSNCYLLLTPAAALAHKQCIIVKCNEI